MSTDDGTVKPFWEWDSDELKSRLERLEEQLRECQRDSARHHQESKERSISLNRRCWRRLSLFGGVVILMVDRSIALALSWWTLTLLLGQAFNPWLYRKAGALSLLNTGEFLLGVIIGWSSIGLQIGAFIGPLMSFVPGAGLSAYWTGLSAILVCPSIAAAEGLCIAGFVLSVSWGNGKWRSMYEG